MLPLAIPLPHYSFKKLDAESAFECSFAALTLPISSGVLPPGPRPFRFGAAIQTFEMDRLQSYLVVNQLYF